MNKLLVIKAMNTPHDHSEVYNLIDLFVESYKNHYPQDTIDIEELVFSELPIADGNIIKLGIKAKITPFLMNAKEKKLMQDMNHYKDLLESADKVVVFDPVWDHEVVRKIEGWRGLLEKMGKTPSPTDIEDVDNVIGNRKVGLVQMVDPDKDNYASQYLSEVLAMTGFKDLKLVEVKKPVEDYLNEIHELANIM